MDALCSLYRMLDSALILKGRVPPSLITDVFIRNGLLQKRIEELLVWWERRNEENVLLIFYDDLKEDHAGSM